ncbi:MAG: aa3-type cytochrome c oxidase subunit IV [Proteobacteria bacterium]|nr:aa3-type cytochrome c oxidase subunit IV [Pseudomonadota bacterium]
MAVEHSKNDPDYQFHQNTYEGVCTLFKVSITLIVITLLLMAWLVV